MYKNYKDIYPKILNNRFCNNYVAGFVHGNGGFSIEFNIKSNKKGNKLLLLPTFNLTENKKNIVLIKKILNLWKNIGNYSIDSNNKINYNTRNIEDIENIIIPFFDKHLLRDNKLLTYIKVKFIIEKLNSIDKEYKWFSYDFKNKYNDLLLDLIILSIHVLPNVKISDAVLKIFNKKDKDLNRILKNDVSLKIMNEFNNYVLKNYVLNKNYKNPLTIDFINGLFDANGWITLLLKLSHKKNIFMGWEYGLISDKSNAKVLFEIKKFFKNLGNITYHKTENTVRFIINKTAYLENILLKTNDINNYMDYFYNYNGKTGSIIKDKKIWIILRLYLFYVNNSKRIETDLNIKNFIWFTIFKYSYLIKPDHLKSKESYFEYIDRMNLKLKLNLNVNSYKKR